jgi:hypothetical protein
MRSLARIWIMALLALASPPAFTEEPAYEVLPAESTMDWQLWVGEGPTQVSSSAQSFWGNRFRLGVELLVGKHRRWIFGLTVLDFISSGESTPDVGGISRDGSDLAVGLFIVPDLLWAQYALHFEEIRGSRISGHESAFGHQLELGARLGSTGSMNLDLVLGFLYVPSQSVAFVDIPTDRLGSANYPTADIWSVGLRVGFDLLK